MTVNEPNYIDDKNKDNLVDLNLFDDDFDDDCISSFSDNSTPPTNLANNERTNIEFDLDNTNVNEKKNVELTNSINDDVNDRESSQLITRRDKKRKLKRHFEKKNAKKVAISTKKLFDIEADEADDEEEDFDDTELLPIEQTTDGKNLSQEYNALRKNLIDNYETAPKPHGVTYQLSKVIENIEKKCQEENYEDESDEQFIFDDEDEVEDVIDPENIYDSDLYADDSSRSLVDIQNSKLWVLSITKSFTHNDAIQSIMNKSQYYQTQNMHFPILAVFTPSQLKDRIYLEARTPKEIQDCLYGIRSITLSSIKLVPLKEMTSVFTKSTKDNTPFIAGEIVRIKSGYYSGDVAQLIHTEDQDSIAVVRIVPRINLTEVIEQKKQGKMFRLDKSKRSVAQLLRMQQIEAHGGTAYIVDNYNMFRFNNYNFEESGFLVKKIRTQSLIRGAQVNATHEELETFRSAVELRCTDKIELNKAFALQEAVLSYGTYSIRENVIVQSEDLHGLKGKIIQIDKETVTIQPENVELNDVSVCIKNIVKYFEIGDCVKIINGTHQGVTGLITSINFNTNTAFVFLPSLSIPFECSINNLKEAPKSGIGTGNVNSLGGYSVGDLVQISEHETGLITQINSGGTFSVLLTDNVIKDIPVSRITSRRSSDFSVPTDVDGNQIEMKAQVSPLNSKGIVGLVHRIWKNHIYIKVSNKETGHNGFLLYNSYELKLNSPNHIHNHYRNHNNSSPNHNSKYQNQRNKYSDRYQGHYSKDNTGFKRQPQYKNRLRNLIGQRIKVVSGRQKGCFGEIISYDHNNRLRVKLSQNSNLVCLEKNDIIIMGDGNRLNGHNSNNHTDKFDVKSSYSHTKTHGIKQDHSWLDYFDSIKKKIDQDAPNSEIVQ